MIGPGKYDALCTLVRRKTKATGVIVIVINGNKGSGMACQADLATTITLPAVLEEVAAQIREKGVLG